MERHFSPSPVADFVSALIQSGAQLALIIDQMERVASRSREPKTRPPVAVLSELIEGILIDSEVGIDLTDVGRATHLLVEATDAIGRNLFFVDPD